MFRRHNYPSLNEIRPQATSRLIGQLDTDQLYHWHTDLSRLSIVSGIIQSEISKRKERTVETSDDLLFPALGTEVLISPSLQATIQQWQHGDRVEDIEIAKRLIDFLVISEILVSHIINDANHLENSYSSPLSETADRIRGTCWSMFQSGHFSTYPTKRCPQVNGSVLVNSFTTSTVEKILGPRFPFEMSLGQVTGMVGVLNQLGKTLLRESWLFGINARPGNMLDYWLESSSGVSSSFSSFPHPSSTTLSIDTIWESVLTLLDSKNVGCDRSRLNIPYPWGLKQWLVYCILVPVRRFTKLDIINQDALTGVGAPFATKALLEAGVLRYRPGVTMHQQQHQQQELQAATVCLMDAILRLVNNGSVDGDITLAQMLHILGSARSAKNSNFIDIPRIKRKFQEEVVCTVKNIKTL